MGIDKAGPLTAPESGHCTREIQCTLVGLSNCKAWFGATHELIETARGAGVLRGSFQGLPGPGGESGASTFATICRQISR
jgi:hypothetical protein